MPILLFLLLWEAVSYSIGEDKLPHLWTLAGSVIHTFFSDDIIRSQGGGQGYSWHIAATGIHFLIAFAAGGVLGLLLAIVLSQFATTLFFLNTLVELLRVIPPLLFIPFCFLLTGFNPASAVLPSLLYTCYAIFIYSLQAIRNVDRQYILLSRQLGAGRWHTVLNVLVPGMLPGLSGGVKVTAGLALGIVIVAEYLQGPYGIGSVLKFSLSFTRIELIFVGIFWSVVMAVAADMLISLIFRRLTRWK